MWRLWELQLKNGEKYTEAIRRQCIRTVRLAPIRGRIESSDGFIYTDNLPSFDLEFNISQFRRRRFGPLNSTLDYINRQIENISYFTNIKVPLSRSRIKKILTGSKKERLFSLKTEDRGFIQGLFWDKNYFEISNNDEQLDIYLLPSKKRIESQGQRARTAQAIAKTIQNINDIIKHYPNHISKELRYYLLKTNQKNVLQQLELNLNLSLDIFQRQMRYVLFDYWVYKIIKHIERTPALPYIGVKNLTKQELSRITELQPPIAGVDLLSNSLRHYNNSTEVAHIVGYLQKEEFKKRKFDNFFYFQDEFYGRAGLEYKLNDILAGEGAMQLLQVDIAGFTRETIKDSKYLKVLKQKGETKNGKNVTLTIDSKAQHIAYELMKQHTGSLVVVDCTNGDIKAMVSTPSYNLNTFRNDYSSLVNDENRPFSNRATLAGYFPGSIVKPIIALAALRKYDLDPLDIYHCSGEYKISRNYKVRCSVRSGHGDINLFEAIEQSCNPFFINLGVRCGIKTLKKIYEEFGVGQKIDLPLTQIKSGLLPGQGTWSKAETCYVSIGQGKISTSPLQLAFVTSLIANKGRFYKPHIVEKISDPYTNKELMHRKVKVERVLDIKKKYWDMIHHGMRLVVEGDNATARRAFSKKGIQIAGKTGTVERRITKSKYEYLLSLDKPVKTKGRFFYAKDTWFSCFFPYKKPRYAVVVFIENGESGGRTSAPIARKFIDLWLGDKKE